jgi:hypothetical protein
METAIVTVSTTPQNKLHLRDVTPAQACILVRMHQKEAGGQPLAGVIVTGEATTRVRAGVEIVNGERRQQYEEHPRTDAEERERLRKMFSGNIRVGKDNIPALQAVFPNPMDPLPQTFEEVQQHLGEGVEILTAEAAAEIEQAKREAKAKADAKAKKPKKVKPEAGAE